MRSYYNNNRRPTNIIMFHLIVPRVSSFLLLFLLLSTVPLFVSGYASWLRCYVELDESEVVMHQYIVPADETTDVTIGVQEYGTTDWLSEYSTSTTTPFNIKVRLEYPDYLLRQDVQYVIEIVTEEDYYEEQKQEEEEEENISSKVAEFIDRGVMCDGQRAFSRSSDHVVLQIHDVTKPIELVAGYAPGMEAVRLTRKFIINNINNNNTSSSGDDTAAAAAAAEDKGNNQDDGDDDGGRTSEEEKEL